MRCLRYPGSKPVQFGTGINTVQMRVNDIELKGN